MLRITAMKSEKYFTEGLQKADYYRDQVLLDPVYVGSLAEMLGIAGASVTAENFTQLFNNINPVTGLQVTPVMAKDRKNYYDFTFSAPKSVSVLWATTDNSLLHESISKAFDESVRESMEFAEKRFSLARDKRGGGNVYNNTENLLYSFFRHDTARPVHGIADPHLHTHCTVFNMTFDAVVGKFKAMEFHDFAKYRNQIEAYHHSTLAKKLQELGVGIENTYNSFEVAGFNRELIEKFSNRTKIIEEYVLINDISSQTAKGEAGRKTREKKQSQELSREQSKENWISRFSSSEVVVLRGIETSFTCSDSVVRENTEESTKTAVEQSINHFLERDTVVDQNAVITYAMNSNLANVDYFDVVKVLDSKLKSKEVVISKEYQDSSKLINGMPNQNVRGGNRVEFLTTNSVIEQENEIIKYIEKSTGNYKPINVNYQLEKSMSADQDEVFYGVMMSKNSIDVIRGNPGTGKTYLLKELKRAIESSDKTLYA
jgi:conjugative relaxase-like TrwC/TraI family protein